MKKIEISNYGHSYLKTLLIWTKNQFSYQANINDFTDIEVEFIFVDTWQFVHSIVWNHFFLINCLFQYFSDDFEYRHVYPDPCMMSVVHDCKSATFSTDLYQYSKDPYLKENAVSDYLRKI